MATFIECWGKLKSKDFRHADKSEVLSNEDRASIEKLIESHAKQGVPHVEAATAAIRQHLSEVEGQLQSIHDQVGVKPVAAPAAPPAKPPAPEPPVSPELPSKPGAMTGLSKDFISKDRAERGEQPLSQQARIGNEETWDKSGQQFAANPNVGHELVQALTGNPRALTQDDLGVLLRHRVNLTNETEFSSEIASNPNTPLPQKAEALQRLAALQDARNQADSITRSAGSQLGRSFQFLQQLATQDYSLSSLLQQRRAARAGTPFSPERAEAELARTKEYSEDILKADQEWQNYLKEGAREQSALKGYKTRLRSATTELERRQAFSDFEPVIRKQLGLDPEALRLKANFERARDKFQRQLYKDAQINKPLWLKIFQGASYAARESALSGIATLGKLAAFTGAKLGEIPLTETAERVWGQIPGFKKLSKTSEFGPGANVRQLGEFYKEFFTTGMKEAWQMLTGKGSPTRQALEKEKRFSFPSFFGNLHGVEKTPLLIGSQRMNRMKLMQNEMSKLASEAIERGEDISDPLTQGAINYKAFQKATYDILQEQNGFANWINRGLEQLESRKKATGEFNVTQAALANLAKIFLTKGIVRVPANYVKQTLERTPLGLARGVGGAARAWYKGVENVSPAERTAIMKLMGVGSVGSGFFLWGALDALKPPDKRMFGGYYQPREDREKTGDVHFGAIRPAGKEIPHLFTHNPMTESAQMGSTLMRVATSLISKKDPRNRGFIEGAIRSVFGLAEQAPVSGQAFRLSKIGEPTGPTSVVGEAVRGLIPQLAQNFAQWTDEDVKRKPRTVLESVEMGIPILRKNVPEKGTKEVKPPKKPL